MQVESEDTIAVAGAPALPGLVFRHFRGPADYAGLAAAGNASREADGNDWVAGAEDVAVQYEHLENCDLATDIVIAEGHGEIIGFVRGQWLREASGLYSYAFALGLDPAWRAHGVRRAMLRWAEARLRQVAADHPAGAPKVYTTGAPQVAAGLVALLESEGYRPDRYFYKMVRSLAEPIPDFPLPPGLELRPVRPEQYRPIWDASHEAFRDHWGYSPWSEEEYERWLKEPVQFMPALWQVAWDVERDEIAGQIQTYIDARENEKFARRRGYTEGISVRRSYRRRGLARAMIAASLRTLKAHGMTESALNVDAESLTGAMRLYEACGFVVDETYVAYRKPLDAPVAWP